MGSRPRDGDDTRPAATEAVGKNLHAGGTCVPNRLFRPRSSPNARRLASRRKQTLRTKDEGPVLLLFIYP